MHKLTQGSQLNTLTSLKIVAVYSPSFIAVIIWQILTDGLLLEMQVKIRTSTEVSLCQYWVAERSIVSFQVLAKRLLATASNIAPIGAVP